MLEVGYDFDNDVVFFRRMVGNILSVLVVCFDL